MDLARQNGVPYLLRFHGLHGYAFSSCLATGVLEPSEVKDAGSAVVGEPTSGSTAACGRGVYTSADVAKADKYAYGIVLGLAEYEPDGACSNKRDTRIVLLVGVPGMASDPEAGGFGQCVPRGGACGSSPWPPWTPPPM